MFVANGGASHVSSVPAIDSVRHFFFCTFSNLPSNSQILCKLATRLASYGLPSLTHMNVRTGQRVNMLARFSRGLEKTCTAHGAEPRLSRRLLTAEQDENELSDTLTVLLEMYIPPPCTSANS